ncbi:hypothetical protein NEMIN01_1342 [Nematocida minor]|uniref:uncharacterized protein n=1 Tax=Nematocida minor TaxID=1912983 RepID=UPI0022206351|nr:uncharacterized protein NEMIN01_1342 [Nematocida minor]KAI5191073.1 hypothetical protein NEMIN01_1342 [Nematocida minor]
MGHFISKCLNRKKRSVVFLGAPGSGKNSIIKILRKEKNSSPPNNMYQEFTVHGKGYAVDVYDVSEEEKHVNFWKFYFENCSLAIFVVNISDEAKIAQAKEVFENFFTSYGLNKESILFLLNDGTIDQIKEEEDAAPKRVDSSAMVRSFINEHFSAILGLNRKVLAKHMVVSSETTKNKLLSFICKNLHE